MEEPEDKRLEEFEKIMLDAFCSDILAILWKSDGMRFNEIYRALRNKGIELSKPTLSEHLKHLRKKKWLTRTVNGVQNVTYTLHKSIRRNTKEETDEWLNNMLSKIPGVIIENPSPEEHAGYDLCNILIQTLEDVALRLNIEPKIHYQSLNFSNSKARIFENDLVRECNKDEKYRNVVFRETKELIKIFTELRTIITDS
jgi:predicted transcriptional regulator